jgi:hypothetical protein
MSSLRRSLLWLFALGIGSCATSPAAPAESALEISANDYGRFFEATVLTLREAGFQIDRHDYRFGQVSTHPLAQATALEPWRSSSAHAEDPLRSTLNFQRLIATVSLEPLGKEKSSSPPAAAPAPLPAPSYTLRVQVDIEQLQRPDSYVTGSARVISRYSRPPAELAERGVPGVYWEAIGRDETMEHDLLQRILRRSTELSDEPPSAAHAPLKAF